MNDILNKFFKVSFGEPEKDISQLDINSERGRKNLDLIVKNLINENVDKVSRVEKNVKTINSNFDQKIAELQYKINKVVEKVRGAILTERGTSGAIYTTQIPINKQQISNKTTTQIKDGIAFGVPENSEEYSNDLSLLSLKNLEFTELHLRSLNKHSNDALENFIIEPKTQTSTPIEFKINLSGVIRTDSSLVLDLKTHGIIEVYKNGQLYQEKSLLKNVIIPVDINTTSIGIRSYPAVHKTTSLSFNKIGYTELIYGEATYFESKNIDINKDFSQLVIDTCDNSNDPNIEINYHISINNGEWESFSPVMKHTALEKQSIITIDKSQILKMYTSQGIKHSDGDYRFLIPNNLQTNLVYKHDIFLKNNRGIDNKALTFTVQEDTVLIKQAILKNATDKLFINNRLVKVDDITLYKGINKIMAVSEKDEVSSLNTEYLNTLLGKDNSYISTLTKEILTDSTGNKYISLSVPEFIDSFDTVGEVYFPGVKAKHLVSTVRVKAELKSIDKKTVPFISRLLVRGV